MRKQCLWLAGVLLGPVLAHAQSPVYDDDLARYGYWLSVGLGGGTVKSAAPAPSAGRDAFGASIDTGIRFTPAWGIGLEYGIVAPGSGCGGHHCSPSEPEFAPDFTRWFLIGEYRPPNDRRLRLRVGVGVSNMCYSHYRAEGASAWQEFLEAVLFDDYDVDTEGTHWSCKSLSALGGSVSLGYQWELEDTHSSIGLQLRAEGANFAASSKAGTPAFRHRAVMLQVQFNIN
jgi:hypothetical protein